MHFLPLGGDGKPPYRVTSSAWLILNLLYLPCVGCKTTLTTLTELLFDDSDSWFNEWNQALLGIISVFFFQFSYDNSNHDRKLKQLNE